LVEELTIDSFFFAYTPREVWQRHSELETERSNA